MQKNHKTAPETCPEREGRATSTDDAVQAGIKLVVMRPGRPETPGIPPQQVGGTLRRAAPLQEDHRPGVEGRPARPGDDLRARCQRSPQVVQERSFVQRHRQAVRLRQRDDRGAASRRRDQQAPVERALLAVGYELTPEEFLEGFKSRKDNAA